MIAYLDTSVLLKLLVDDETGTAAAERLWLDIEFVVCAEIGYAEARAALAAAWRGGRMDARTLAGAKAELDSLWTQLDVVPITRSLVLEAGELAASEALRGYDAVHLAAAVAARVDIFATSDDRLLAAAHRRGFDVSDPARPEA